MSGIYIHVPFCHRACNYCDFHFSTSLRYKSDFVSALVREIALRKEELEDKPKTLYFGGGTPSQLDEKDLDQIFNAIHEAFPQTAWTEITFEANPEDLSKDYLRVLKSFGINRLSIGVQSFDENLLRYMNRAHSKERALHCIEQAYAEGIEHISLDLIYGLPGLSNAYWEQELRIVEQLPVNHLSCYALTVEQGTPLAKSIRLGKSVNPDDHNALEHFEMLQQWGKLAGWEHYEVSNLCKPDNRALHNSAYWSGSHYLGFGPSAHSFRGMTRRINIANNVKYIRALHDDLDAPHVYETLSLRDRFNEMILTGIRTSNGIDVPTLRKINTKQSELLLQKVQNEVDKYDYDTNESSIKLKTDYWFQSDGIAADLMILDKEWLI
jgi:oxygen-independent coproporphyrinogen-3 oxidase